MKIGLSQRIILYKNRAYDSLDQSWYHYLESHKIFPVSNRIDQDLETLAQNLDCLIITGGDDNPIRRLTEIRLANKMLLLRKPIIGVCHGCFLLTDILGGQIGDIDGHSDVTHDVSYFGEIQQVNSHHTLCIKQPHTKATVLASDNQGNCEAWIDGNLAGIVWHPERMDTPWIPEEIHSLINK